MALYLLLEGSRDADKYAALRTHLFRLVTLPIDIKEYKSDTPTGLTKIIWIFYMNKA